MLPSPSPTARPATCLRAAARSNYSPPTPVGLTASLSLSLRLRLARSRSASALLQAQVSTQGAQKSEPKAYSAVEQHPGPGQSPGRKRCSGRARRSMPGWNSGRHSGLGQRSPPAARPAWKRAAILQLGVDPWRLRLYRRSVRWSIHSSQRRCVIAVMRARRVTKRRKGDKEENKKARRLSTATIIMQ
ncbi:hypothetical protein C7974DRAFT_70873 [Boeremia exigua]|uniref:uncharacterized protein n=1 Tax=Boeremia exigua TaxID=749465 RepID=UPI001E8DB510|nr:uncharacterized protein C7974DRAFT_70873 [Boeremia exigua]KAH6614102.1 hypothetical protein C7974DRAFT_70873 [Boeremia exigua]